MKTTYNHEYDSGNLLSLIIGGRNDNFMGNFKWRLAATLNFMAESLSRIGRLDDVEVVVCDWGSERPLHLEMKLTPLARQIARFVVVPPHIAEPLQQDSPFPIPIVQNVAIRRCRGKYIAQTDSEILFTDNALDRLLKILEGHIDVGVSPDRALLVASRKHVPYELTMCQPSIKELETYLLQYGAMLPGEFLIPGIGTPSALALMHRALWDELGGYDERLIYWGWMEIDLYLRIGQKYPWLDTGNAGVIVYHLEHYPKNDRTDQRRKANPTQVPVTFRANDDNWGLCNEPLAIETAPDVGRQNRHSVDSSHWRVDQLSAMPAEQIQAMIADPSIAWQVDQVQKTIDSRTSAVSQFTRSLRAAYGWGYREALAWCAQQINPINYLEVGIGASDAAVHVAANFPPVNIFGVWVRSSGSGRYTPEIPTIFSDLMTKVDHRGYMRHKFTLENEAIPANLEMDFPAPCMDLIFVHPTAVHLFKGAGLPDPVHYLRPGGVLVWSSKDPETEARQYAPLISREDMLLIGANVLLLVRSRQCFASISEAVRQNWETIFDANRTLGGGPASVIDRAALGEHNDSAPHHFNEGIASYNNHDGDQAIAHLKKATCLQPHCHEYRKILGQLYMALKHDTFRALCEYQQALRICPEDMESLAMAEMISRAMGRHDLADIYLVRQGKKVAN